MVFAYDFPNFKTQEILIRLLVEGYPVKYVIGAPWRKLNRPATAMRDAPSFVGLMQTRDICERFGVPYHVFEHNSPECEAFIAAHPVRYGIIAGAQILKGNIINQFKAGGIINTHEAMLPWIRGIETLKYSIYRDLPMANSIHFIDESIDQGKLIYQEKVELKPDDTLIDISLRMIQIKPEVLVKALQRLEAAPDGPFIDLTGRKGEYVRMMPPEMASQVPGLLPAWLERHRGPAVELNPLDDEFVATAGRNLPTS